MSDPVTESTKPEEKKEPEQPAEQKERPQRYEELPPEMLEILKKELEEFKASFPADKPVTKNGLKNKEKEIRKRLTKELKARKREDAAKDAAPAASSTAPQELVTLTNSDPSAPLLLAKDAPSSVGKRVYMRGWVADWMPMKRMLFFHIRDASGYLQCIVEGDAMKSVQASKIKTEVCLIVFGTIQEGKGKKDPYEIAVDYIEIVGECLSDFEQKLNKDSGVEQRFDLRHLDLRSEVATRIMRVRSELLFQFRSYLHSRSFREVTPPTLVQNACEGGSKMFEVKYYDKKAFLTESSQLYLETCIQSLGDVFCMLPSYRAEESLTRRHLAEFTHLEAEMPFYTFDKLLDFLKDFIYTVCTKTLEACKSDLAVLKEKFNMDTCTAIKSDFIRMKYVDAIKWLNEHDKPNPKTGKPFQVGEDIPEGPERFLVDTIGQPILLTDFPTPLKAFYMKRTKEDAGYTESVDVLMPNVGEIVGGSVRIHDYDELMLAFKERPEMDPASLQWYAQLREFGTVPHAGFGLGVERILCWLCGIYHIRDACLYPRYMGRITP